MTLPAHCRNVPRKAQPPPKPPTLPVSLMKVARKSPRLVKPVNQVKAKASKPKVNLVKKDKARVRDKVKDKDKAVAMDKVLD